MTEEQIRMALRVAELVLDTDPETGEGIQEQIERLADLLECHVPELLDLGANLAAHLE